MLTRQKEKIKIENYYDSLVLGFFDDNNQIVHSQVFGRAWVTDFEFFNEWDGTPIMVTIQYDDGSIHQVCLTK